MYSNAKKGSQRPMIALNMAPIMELDCDVDAAIY